MRADADTPKPLAIRAAGGTDVGCVRKRNEDAFLVDAENGIFIVADGVGGHGGGDKAAQMATTLLPDIIKRRIAESPEPRSSDDPAIVSMLADSLQELGHLIRKAGASRLEYKDMGATVVLALLTAHHAHIAHMGDSRAYLLRDGDLRQLTEDHSIVGLLVRNGEITPQEAASHPAKGRLSRFAGMEADVPAATQTVELQPGNRLLLCTDGLWGMLPDAQLTMILTEGNDPEVTCSRLLLAGRQEGGMDNITAVVADLYVQEFRDGDVVYHGYPCPPRLWKAMLKEHADALIGRGVFYMNNQREYRKEPPPRGDPKEGMLEFGFGGALFCVHSGNHVHVWCATAVSDPQRLFEQWPDYDAIVEILHCRNLFQRVVNACREQRVDYAEIHAGFARYDRGQLRPAWPQWEHGHFQKDVDYDCQKEYRFEISLNLDPAMEVPYQKNITIEIGDCRDLVRLVATRGAHS
jgi:protein phosphatase